MSESGRVSLGAVLALIGVGSVIVGVREFKTRDALLESAHAAARVDAGSPSSVKATFAEASFDPVVTDLKPGELRFKDEHGAVRVRSGLTNAWPVVIDVFVPGDTEKHWRVSIEADGSMRTEQRRYQP